MSKIITLSLFLGYRGLWGLLPFSPCDVMIMTCTWHSIPSSLCNPVLLYAADMRTLLVADVRSLHAFCQKCLRQLLGIHWYHRVQNYQALQRIGQGSLSDLVSCRCTSFFWHAVCSVKIHLYKALHLHVNMFLSPAPDCSCVFPCSFTEQVARMS